MFIAPLQISPATTTSSTTKTTLISRLRRVSSFSSISSISRSSLSSRPQTPTAPTSPTSSDDMHDPLPQDIPRSSSVMSWFSSDEEEAERKPWRLPKLRRKNRLSPKNPAFTFTTSAAALASEDPVTPSSLGAPLYLSCEPVLLPAVHPIELDLALDFDCAFPRPYDSDESSEPTSPPFSPSFSIPPCHDETALVLQHPRNHVSWWKECGNSDVDEAEDHLDTQTLYAPSSLASPHTSSPWSSIRRASRSPEMTEEDMYEDDPTFGKFDDVDERNEQVDPDVCRQLAAFRILPQAPALVATPQTPSLRPSCSVESLLDPFFTSPSTPSPGGLSSAGFSSNLAYSPSSKTGFSFPLPPASSADFKKDVSFLGFDLGDEDDDAPYYDCTL
ncbi:uncharacterized protein JCM15063_002252 [Sporobolomyces koalae]|uniref:uncharacterized protein n=1 Tax=Sporobolomyces koalae TaxID=500713 RepID=UPI00316C07BB